MHPFLFEHLRRASRIIGLALSALAFLALAALGIGPHTGRYRTLTVLSASMRPGISEGSVVLATPVRLREVRVGDVLAYQVPVEDRRVVSHRVVEVVEAGERPVVRTQGDANRAPDPWLARLSGGPGWKVRAAVPGLGYAVSALRRPQVRSLLIGVVPLILALIWLAQIWAPARGRRAGAGPVPATDRHPGAAGGLVG